MAQPEFIHRSSVSSKLDYVSVQSSGTPSYKVIVEEVEVQQSVSNYSQAPSDPAPQQLASVHKNCIVGAVKQEDSPNFDQIAQRVQEYHQQEQKAGTEVEGRREERYEGQNYDQIMDIV